MNLRERYRGESARDYALHMLRENIISLKLAPGMEISVYDLSEWLGVSRTPVREAVLELGKTGIIEIYPQKGSRISYVNFEAVNDSRFLRLALERAIIEEVCEIAQETEIEELHKMIQLQEFYASNFPPEELLKLDNDFHRKLFEICGRVRVFGFKDSLEIHFDRIRNIRLFAIQDDRVVREHRMIVNAIENRNKEAARIAVDRHLSGYSRQEQEQIEQRYPEYFAM